MRKGKFLSDAPADEDRLLFTDYGKVLAQLCQSCETPMTIGIHGSWGTGKTTLLKLVEKELEDSPSSFQIIWFNAWKFQHEEEPWKAMILLLFDALEKKIRILKRAKLELRKIFKRISLPVLTKEIINLVVLKKIDLGEIENIDKFNKKVYAIASLADLFSLFVRETLKDDERLVIFIDDLERCSREQSLEILEMIRLFLEFPNCIYLIAFDKNKILEGLRKTKKLDMTEAQDYLDKMLQISFALPRLTNTAISQFVDSLDIRTSFKDIYYFGKMIACGTENNPRKIKRLLNFLELQMRIHEIRGFQADPLTLAKVNILINLLREMKSDFKKEYIVNFIRTLEKIELGNTLEEVKSKIEILKYVYDFAGSLDLKNLDRYIFLIEELENISLEIQPLVSKVEETAEEKIAFIERLGELQRKGKLDSTDLYYINQVVTKLLTLVDEEDAHLRKSTVTFLGQIMNIVPSPRREEILQKTMKMSHDLDWRVRGHSITNLEKLYSDCSEKEKAQIRILVSELSEETNEWVRIQLNELKKRFQEEDSIES